ncbi:unnamed protein product [Ambrosiozyma monospora]|uniref:Unnamed protein product n=1 Tax=Ambrosiozyma monospora TaxID=43982 RepID=A0ACB5SS84_AMBMO|nr:unnamed protein product [Ambrosiozyma monospora]
MFGDSLTEFAFKQFPLDEYGAIYKKPIYTMGAALSEAYTGKMDILQRGFGGYTSKHAIQMISGILDEEHDSKPAAEQIKLAYFYFGSNDARLMGSLGPTKNLEHVPIDQFAGFSRSTVIELLKRDIKVVIMTPGLHNQETYAKTYPEDLITGDYRSNETNLEYVNVLVKLGAELDVPVVNVYGVFKKSGLSDEELLTDGIHFNSLGYKLVFDALMDTIENEYPELHPVNFS